MGVPDGPGGLLRCCLTLHLLLLLRLGSAQFRVVGPGRPLRAAVGQDVVLPCRLAPSMDARGLEIRWIRNHFTETVHLYRDGEDLYREQMREYDGRTELVRDGLSAGSLDLRIVGLRPSDDGQYICTVQGAAFYNEAVMELEVAATGSVPHLALEAYEGGGIRVGCRSAGWYPQPELLWKGPGAQHLPSVYRRRFADERGLFEVEDVVVVTGIGDGNLSCVVRSRRLSQEQESSLRISAPFFHDARPWKAALGVFLVLWAVFAGLSAYLWRRKVTQSRELEERESALAWRRFLLPENPEVVTLDAKTAHSRLVLSQDLRSVTRKFRWEDECYSPERFRNYCCVLGREGFREGRHCWEVEVVDEQGGDSLWAVGVARESVKREGFIYLSPEAGVWALCYRNRKVTALTYSRTPLSLSPIPRRIWVCLDCTRGLVTFLGADRGVEIFTFPPASFTAETIRPWLLVGTLGTRLVLRDSPPQTLHPAPAPAPETPCPPPASPRSPLLPAAAADLPPGPAAAQGAEGR